jgi:(p)ppGpp synthase/HD superfamily hydrolase
MKVNKTRQFVTSELQFLLAVQSLADELHDGVNHMYGNAKDLPYIYHLLETEECLDMLTYLFPDQFDLEGLREKDSLSKHVILRAAGFLHDTIEDTRVSYNELRDLVQSNLSLLFRGQLDTIECHVNATKVVEIVFACTDVRGRTRDERHGGDYWSLLLSNEDNVLVKLADRFANSKYSLTSKSSMFKKYTEEFPDFRLRILEAFPDSKPVQHLIQTLTNLYNLG